MSTTLGRYVFGLSVIGLGIGTLLRRDFILQLEPASMVPPAILIDCIAVAQIAGGAAMLLSRTARAGATVLAIVYGIYSLLWIPGWIRHPLVFDYVGNFFEQFSLMAGALVVCGGKPARFGYYGFGVSVISFAAYQAVHPDFTATLVPKWIPPGQMFWVIATTAAFALAAIALLTGRSALLAARLTVLMLFLFGVIIWVPATLANPHSVGNWSETGLNFAICGATWIIADYLAARAK